MTGARESLVEDCKDLFTDYRITRSPRCLTRLREALNTLQLLSSSARDRHYSIANEKMKTLTISTTCKTDTATITSTIGGYKERWGIPAILGLAGGGESSLNNSATASWAASPTTPNNNNQAQSGWSGGGGAPGTPGTPGNQAGPPNNWQSVTGPRNIASQIGNQNQNQNQGPPGPPNPGTLIF